MRFGWLMVLPAIVGCSDPFTGVDVTLDADGCFATRVERLEVRVLDANGDETGSFEETSVGFPTGVRVKASDPARTWQIVARAYDDASMPIGELTVTGGFTPGILGTHRAVFQDACYGVSCPEGRVCRDGRCDRAIDVPFGPATTSPACPPIAWVDGTSGVDEADCTDRTAPCATPKHAVLAHAAVGSPGPLVFVRGGVTYTGSGTGSTLQVDVSGTAEHPVTLRAWPGTGTPTIDGMGAQRKTIDVNAGHVVIDGFEVIGAGEHGVSLNGGHVRDVALLRCDIHGNGTAEMTMYDNRAGVILNNGPSEIVIAENAIHHNQNPDPTVRVDGVYSNDGFGGLLDVVVVDNAIHDNRANGLRLLGGNTTLVQNRIYGHPSHNVTAAGDGIALTDNVLCDAEGSGVVIGAAEGVATNNNTIVGSGEAAVSITAARGSVLSRNIFYGNVGAGVAANSDIDDSFNLYFDNGVDTEGFARAQPDTDVFSDPELVEGTDPCSWVPGPGSPALGAGPDGADLGARR